jgi:hypothetical protein
VILFFLFLYEISLFRLRTFFQNILTLWQGVLRNLSQAFWKNWLNTRSYLFHFMILKRADIQPMWIC